MSDESEPSVNYLGRVKLYYFWSWQERISLCLLQSYRIV